jgi:hypothetical protein
MDYRNPKYRALKSAGLIWVVAILFGCFALSSFAAMPANPQAKLIAKGKTIFFNETFNGNGRTCGTCHPAENNLTLDPAFIATLRPNNPLFVAEFNPDLKKNFENPRLMREFALILENLVALMTSRTNSPCVASPICSASGHR